METEKIYKQIEDELSVMPNGRIDKVFFYDGVECSYTISVVGCIGVHYSPIDGVLMREWDNNNPSSVASIVVMECSRDRSDFVGSPTSLNVHMLNWCRIHPMSIKMH